MALCCNTRSYSLPAMGSRLLHSTRSVDILATHAGPHPGRRVPSSHLSRQCTLKSEFLQPVAQSLCSGDFSDTVLRNTAGGQVLRSESVKFRAVQLAEAPEEQQLEPAAGEGPGAAAEKEAERKLAESHVDCIAGIPKHEWLRLQKPARYLGNEFGAIHKPWDSASVRFCLTYPEVYEVGASNLGHILLYTVLNGEAGLLCDRCYFVGEDMAACLKRLQKPLFALESQRALREFDTLGFSLSYELGGTNVLEMLQQAGVPLTWEDRQEGADQPWDVDKGSWPLIFAGGPTATSNPEPFSDFYDFFAVGDGEECLPEIGHCLTACKAEGLSRHATLLRLACSVKGVYVPQLYENLPGWGGAVFPKFEGVPERVLRRVAMPDPMQQIGLVPYVETVHDRLTVEIRRGCTRGCRFCQPGMLTRPARDVEPERVVQAVEEGMRKTGYTEFSLLSLSCSDYLALPAVGIEIKNRLKGVPISLSLPSQRVDRFNDDVANIIGGTRQGSLTFAPEAGTQRMRDIINKGLTDEELLRGVKTAWDKGWRQVKLYFMIGLPGETDEDVLGIARTVKWLQSQCRRGKQFLAVRLTISNFTPKPHTPFQWHTVSTAEFTRKQRLLKKAFERMWGVKYNFTDVRLSAMEDFIGRGDRSLGKVMLRAWELGATNDAWWMATEQNFVCWQQAIEEAGLSWKYRQVEAGEWDVMEMIGDERYRGQGGGGKGRVDRGDLADARLDAPLPWDIIDTGVAKWWLKADLQRALEAATVPDCSHSGHCSKCGVCGDDFGDNVVAQIPEVPEFDGHFTPNTDRTQRLRVQYTKEGSMALIGHLDVTRLLDRALRRAALPVSYDKGVFLPERNAGARKFLSRTGMLAGRLLSMPLPVLTPGPSSDAGASFHSHPRISTVQPLPLGYSSSCELVDIDLTERVPLDAFRSALQSQLPTELRVQEVSEVPVRRADGKGTEALTHLLYAAEYIVALGLGSSQEEAATHSADSLAKEAPRWVEAVLQMDAFEATVEGKKGRKDKVVDLRKRLLALRLFSESRVPGAMRRSWTAPPQRPILLLHYVGSVDPTEGNLRPEGVLQMLQGASGRSFELLHVHRLGLRLHPPSVPKIDHRFLRSVAQDEAFRGLYRRFDGTSLLHENQPEDPMDAARSAQRVALGKPAVCT